MKSVAEDRLNSNKKEEATTLEKQLITERLADFKVRPGKVKKWEDVKKNYLKKK